MRKETRESISLILLMVGMSFMLSGCAIILVDYIPAIIAWIENIGRKGILMMWTSFGAVLVLIGIFLNLRAG